MSSNGTVSSVVITGASTGIGEACALHLDRLGMRVFAGVRNDADGEALRAKASGRLVPLRLDVTIADDIAAAARMVDEQLAGGGLAGLVNNAGISVAAPLEFVPLDDFRRQLEVNVTGVVAVTQAFLPALRRGNGRIATIGSISGKLATPFLGPYSASKFALEALTDALRMELRPWRIRVALIEPGSIATPIWEKGLSAADELQARMPARAMELYGEAVDALRKTARKTGARGIPPDRVASAVAHALLARRPKTRYVVGTDARLQALFAGVAPDGVLDAVIEQQMGLRQAHAHAASQAAR
jgi:NAD(P)-dependent dehydrogenase (short-subunit alcohol dehydrogenase family)